MERFKFRLIIILAILSTNCNENRKKEFSYTKDDEVFNDVLYSTFDSLFYKHNLEGKTIVHQEIYPDQLKLSILNNTLIELKGDSTIKANLIRELKKVINDSIKINLKKKSRSYNIISDYDKAQYIESSSTIFFNISKVAFNEGKNLGCFYFAIHCGKKCSIGYFVFIKKDEASEWRIAGIIPRWHS